VEKREGGGRMAAPFFGKDGGDGGGMVGLMVDSVGDMVG